MHENFLAASKLGRDIACSAKVHLKGRRGHTRLLDRDLCERGQ